MIVGPLPHGDGVTLERAFLDAIAAADPARDLHTRSLVVVGARPGIANADVYRTRAEHVMPRLGPADAERLIGAGEEADALRALIGRVRVVELDWSEALEMSAAAVRGAN